MFRVFLIFPPCRRDFHGLGKSVFYQKHFFIQMELANSPKCGDSSLDVNFNLQAAPLVAHS